MEKDEQLANLRKELREYQHKEFLVSEFGFSEEEMAEAGKWTEEHYKETKRRGRWKLFLYYYTNWNWNNQGSEMFLRRVTYNSGPFIKE